MSRIGKETTYDNVIHTLRRLADQLESGEISVLRAEGNVEWVGGTRIHGSPFFRHTTIDCEFVGRDVKFR